MIKLLVIIIFILVISMFYIFEKREPIITNYILKIIEITGRKEKKLQAFESWTVRWESRHGQWSSDVQPEVEVFTNEDDANHFADELKKAFKTIKHTSGNRVYIEKSNYKKID
jgi:hypothetical protein